jgi:hypothetical protein
MSELPESSLKAEDIMPSVARFDCEATGPPECPYVTVSSIERESDGARKDAFRSDLSSG